MKMVKDKALESVKIVQSNNVKLESDSCFNRKTSTYQMKFAVNLAIFKYAFLFLILFGSTSIDFEPIKETKTVTQPQPQPKHDPAHNRMIGQIEKLDSLDDRLDQMIKDQSK